MDALVCGIDVGTTSVKAVVVDARGEVLSEAESDPIATDTAAPGSSEQRPAEILAAVRQAVSAASVGARPADVVALALAAQSGSVIPVLDDGAHRAITWMDSRSAVLVASLPSRARETIRAISGWPASAGLGLSTIAWLREMGDDEGVVRWASVDDYLLHELTGEWITNPSNAAGMQLMDTAKGEWSEALCELAGVEPAELSSMVASGSVAGRLTPPAASAMGLAPGTTVVVGGHDQTCAALGLGAVGPGDVMLSTGTAWVLTAVVPRGADAPLTSSLSPHVVDDRWTVSTNLGGLGAVVAWALESFGPAPDDLARRTPDPQGCFFVPSLADGSRIGWGEFVGEPSGPADRLRAVFEACAHETRAALETSVPIVSTGATASPSTEAGRLTVVGGGGRGPALIQMLSDVTQRDLLVSADTSWPAIGAAALAARGVGFDLTGPQERESVTVECRPELADPYQTRARHYRRLRRGLTEET